MLYGINDKYEAIGILYEIKSKMAQNRESVSSETSSVTRNNSAAASVCSVAHSFISTQNIKS